MMKEKLKTFLSVCLLILALPFIITLIFQGNLEQDQQGSIIAFIAKQFVTQKDQVEEVPEKKSDKPANTEVDVEVYLLGMTANEIPITYEEEMLKAQIVVARTNLLSAIEKDLQLPESISSQKMLELWGQEDFTENYELLSNAIKSTEGETIVYQDNYIDAAFHAVSAGMTRSAKEVSGNDDLPYLVGVDSRMDIPSPDFLRVIFLEKKDFIEVINSNWEDAVIEEENVLQKIEITQRDSADYVNEVVVGGTSVSGEEFRKAYELSSACFYLAEVEGQIRIVTKGLGHGLGLSQYGGNELAKGGKNYKDILKYYFKDIEIKK